MKSTLLLLLFFVPTFGFSQYYPDSNSYCPITSYYDYSLCAKGMKNDSGEVVLSPRYDEIFKIANDLILVEADMKFGLLNCEFDTILPITYKSLQWVPKQDHKAKHGPDYYWVFETEEGTGLMNSSLEVMIPPNYDRIGRAYAQYPEHRKSYNDGCFGASWIEKTLFFKVFSGTKQGVFNEYGKEIIPLDNAEITYKRLYDAPSTASLPSGYYFHVRDNYTQRRDSSMQSFYSEFGVQLYTDSLKFDMELIGMDSSTVIITTRDYYFSQATCLESKKSTENNYSQIYLKGFLFYQILSDQSFHIYTADLYEVYSGLYPNRFSGSEEFYFKDEQYTKITTYQGEYVLIDRNGELYLRSQDQIHFTQNEANGCFWTIPINLAEQPDTLRTFFASKELKGEYIINDIQNAHFFTKYGEFRYNDLFDPLLFIKKGSKWGALDRSGDLKVPIKFDRGGIPFYPKVLSTWGEYYRNAGYYVYKEEKIGAIDTSGVQLFRCKYDTLIVNFTDSLSLTKKGKHYSLEDTKTSYLKKCDTLFIGSSGLFRPDNIYESRTNCRFERDDEYLYPFAVKKDYLITSINGKERICDSTLLQFEDPLLLVEHLLINEQGKIILEITEGIIRKTKNFFLYINGEVAQVILFNGEKGIQITHFQSAQVEGDYVKVKLKDQTVGAISLNGSSWLFKPKYYDITFTDFPPTHAWVKEDTLLTKTEYGLKTIETYAGNWILVDTLYQKQYNFPFRFPSYLQVSPYTVFQSGKNFGVIDSALNLIFPPDFNNILQVQSPDYFLLSKDSSFQLGHSSGAVFDKSFSCISGTIINNSVAVFSFNERDTLIGFIRFDDRFQWLVPMTEMHELIKKASLNALLDVANDRFAFHYIHKSLPIDSSRHWKIQNNQLVVSYLLCNQCTHSTLGPVIQYFIPDFEFQNPKRWDEQHQFFEDVPTKDHNLIRDYFDYSYIYEPKKLESPNNIYGLNSYKLKFKNSQLFTVLKSKSCNFNYGVYKNYIYLDSVEHVELSDILIKDDRTSDFLREFVLRKFTKNQLLGEVCPDLAQMEALIWSSFYFEKGCVAFSRLDLKLSYDELKPYLTKKGKRLNPW